jgi:excisionase family DNA binding protein
MIGLLISGKNDPSWELAQKLARYFNIPAEILFELSASNSTVAIQTKKLYDVDEFCVEILNNKVSKSTIYAKIKTGEIKAIKIGRKPLIPAWFVEELLTSHNI